MMLRRVSGLLIKRKGPTAPRKQTSRKRESCSRKRGNFNATGICGLILGITVVTAESPKSTAFHKNRFKTRSNHKSPKSAGVLGTKRKGSPPSPPPPNDRKRHLAP
ncbi:hypothetical protein CEXT_789041 [Caerostris extrusa]|uniref:Uncharacterized protein n=1 Tax=Caerostris extrusa TaxID=172846 RepID=A0AAV4YEZ2_CAEEX|nr:hypothetical protein CEXT_789041 [Caerostris extrusa]